MDSDGFGEASCATWSRRPKVESRARRGAVDELLPGLAAAADEGRAAFGERAGQRDGRVGRDDRWEPLVKGPLCAEIERFSLHAGSVGGGA